MGELVIVTGDKTIDWVIAEEGNPEVHHDDERLRAHVTVCWHPGGVFLLDRLIRSSVNDIPDVEVKCAYDRPLASEIRAYDNPYNHTFSVIKLLRKHNKKRGRIKSYSGFHEAGRRRKNPPPSYDPAATVIAIDDASLGFRDNSDNWSNLIPPADSATRPWVLYKMSQKAATGMLWEYILDRLHQKDDWLADKLIVVTTVARLRDAGAEISRDLSWERSVQDVASEILRNDAIQTLAQCRNVIVSFGPTGALLIRREDQIPTYTLVYDREQMEGEWEEAHSNGMMFGYGSALCAAVIRQLVSDGKNIAAGIEMGLAAMEAIYQRGFGLGVELKFPEECLSGDYKAQREKAAERFAIADIHSVSLDYHSSILDLYHHERAEIETLSMRVAKAGEGVLKDVPLGRFGELLTVNRTEIESLRAIRNLVVNYCNRISLSSEPISLAVFGAPGSGKSYAVKQLTEPLKMPDHEINVLEFNLSQLNSSNDLVGALHRVRDVALQGRIPLVFWDEFDSPLRGERLGWLRYFLAPMQDGTFLQGEMVHRIGPSVFVFAGGTSVQYNEFGKQAKEAPPDSKALDFLSRIRGYIDVAGPDPETPDDLHYMLRRALLLNSLFKKKKIGKDGRGHFRVDDEVIRAFLEVDTYHHGARSMRAIVETSRVGEGEPFKRSSLPDLRQLNLHVEASSFLGITRTSPPDFGFLPFNSEAQ
ncbi:hypothetical protein AB0G85_24470 [Streptomyces sioyaensis]|uniref:hypothetical protein n=1 Tax=Streptomyces sioyaensis TaxID=67364 RepID=UPI0033FBC80E